MDEQRHGMRQTLPDEVVREDQRLEATAEKEGETLARLRWRWTLVKSNPNRVSIEEYARHVGKSPDVIDRQVRSYEAEAKQRYFDAALVELEIRRQYGEGGLPPDVSYEQFREDYFRVGPSQEDLERASTNLRFRLIQKRLGEEEDE